MSQIYGIYQDVAGVRELLVCFIPANLPSSKGPKEFIRCSRSELLAMYFKIKQLLPRSSISKILTDLGIDENVSSRDISRGQFFQIIETGLLLLDSIASKDKTKDAIRYIRETKSQ